ncbi:CXXC-rich protein [Entamoeba marina]
MAFPFFILLLFSFSYATTCNETQYLDFDGNCVDCMSYCSSCFDNVSCQRCFTGYELSKNDEGIYVCTSCISNCMSCTMGTCTQCSDNYKLIDGKCEYYEDNSSTVILIIGIIVAVVVVAIAIDIFISFIIKKKKHHKEMKENKEVTPETGL